MELNEQIALQASSLLGGKIVNKEIIGPDDITEAVRISFLIWEEVLIQERER